MGDSSNINQELNQYPVMNVDEQDISRIQISADLDTQSIQAAPVSTREMSGGFEGDSFSLQLKSQGGGQAEYYYEMYTIPDQLILRYEGKEILNTGFVSNSKTGKVNIPVGNSDKLEIILATNDEGTEWDYKITAFPNATPTSTNQAKDQLYEFLAKDVAYKNWQVGQDVSLAYANNQQLQDLVKGYKIDKVFDNSGFFAVGLISSQGNAPILAIRGTEPTKDLFADLFADVNENSVGFNQYDKNRDINPQDDSQNLTPLEWLFQVSEDANKNPNLLSPDITGYSLGGALTQLFAADFTNRGGKLGQVVTFNSPGINSGQAAQFKPENTQNVRHYIINGDLVSLAGEKFLTGEYFLPDFTAGTLDLNLLDNHLLPIITDTVGYDQPLGNNSQRKPGDLSNLDNPSTDFNWLNSPFFTYVDQGFFSWVAAANAVTLSDPVLHNLALLLPFRGTVEANRKQIGAALTEIQAAISNINNLRSGLPGRVNLPNQTFNILGLDFQATNLGMEYLVQPEDIYKIQGKVTIPTLFNATADFSGDNFIQISDTALDVVGSLSAKDITIVPNVWEVKKAQISFDTITQEVSGQGAVYIPTGIEIGGGVGFQDGKLNFISLDARDLNKPIGTTGAFLQSISGNINNLANPDSIEFGGGLGITGGAKVDISLPDVIGGNFSGSIVSLEVNGTLNKERIKGNSNIQILGGLATGNGEAELNWKENFLGGSGNFSILNNLIKADTTFHTNSNFDITMRGNASVNTPDISLDASKLNVLGSYLAGAKINLKGLTLANGEFILQYSNNNKLADDFVWSYGKLPTITIPIPFQNPLKIEPEVTIKASFDGKLDAQFGKVTPETNSFTIDSGVKWLILNANWDNPTTNAAVQVIKPDKTVINESEFADNKIAIIDSLTSSTTKAVIIAEPTAGIWDLQLVDPTDLGNVVYSGFQDSVAPTIEVMNAVTNSSNNITVNYQAFDADSDAKVSLFYDTDNQGFDGILIANDLAETDGNGSFIWNTEGVATGNYYTYAMVLDDNNRPVFSYSPQTVQITESADLLVSKTASADAVTIGDNFTYTVKVTNNGGSNAKGVRLTDTLPEYAEFIDSSVNANQLLDNNLIFDIGDLNSGESREVTVTVAPIIPEIITGTARVTSPTFDPDATNNFAVLATSVELISADLSIAAAAIPVSVNVGEEVTYDLTIKNNSSNTATDVFLTDYLPSELVNVTVTSSQETNNVTDGVVSLYLGELDSGETTTVTISGSAIAAGTLTNNAKVVSNETDPNLNNNSIIQLLAVNPVAPAGADLELSQTVNNTNPRVGDEVTYTISLTNQGSGVASNIQVANLLPSQLSFVSATPEQGDYDSNTGVWDVGNMKAELTRTLNIVAKVNTAGSITTTSEVTAVTEFDPDSIPGNSNANEDDQAALTISAIDPNFNTQADLVVTKTASANSIEIGDRLTYTITITNNGSIESQGVTLTETLPQAVTFVSASLTPATQSEGSLTFNVGNLASSATKTVEITVTAPNTTGVISSRSQINSNTLDPNSNNNVVILDTTVVEEVVVNSPPVATNDTATTQQGTQVVIPVLNNDTDANNNLDRTSVLVANNPNNGTVSVNNTNGEITYTPTTNFSGSDSFTYTVKDTIGATSNPATVNITVNPVTNNLPNFNESQVFSLAGNGSETQQLKLNLVSKNTGFVNEIGVFQVDDAQGSINGITPNNPNYFKTALTNSQVIFSALSNNVLQGVDFSRQLNFDASDRLVFYLVQNSTTATVLADITSGKTPPNVLFAVPTANNNSFAPLQITNSNNQSFTLAWKDTPNSSDNVFDDLVMNVEVGNTTSTPIGTKLQDQIELIDLRNLGTLQANFQVASEAAYDNIIGWYVVDDETGRIGDIKPGDAGYAQAAIAQRSLTHFTRDGIDSAQLQGLIAPYLIADSSRESFLANNPNNTVGNGSLAYFPFLVANPDGVDHVRQLGDNTFGFEDLFGGGDRDYNDIIVKVNFP